MSNDSSPSKGNGLSAWWKPRKKVENSEANADTDVSTTRPTLNFKSKSSNYVKPVKSNEDLIREQRESFLATQNNNFNFGNEVFGVPLEQSLKIAESIISVPSDSPDDFINYGKIPLIVGKCGSFLKSKGLQVEGIFRVAGASRRVKELQYIFSTPPEFGRKLNWEGYTVHDAASLIRRYLNSLPEPLVPLDLYEEFREPVRSRPRILKHIKSRNESMEKRVKSFENIETNQEKKALSPEQLEEERAKTARKQKKIAKDLRNALKEYKVLIDKLPNANKQLLYYLLDILSMFADHSKENLMTARNLSTVFQPSILSHPSHDLTPEEYILSQAIVELMIEYSKRLLPDVGKFDTSNKNSTTNLNALNSLSSAPRSRPHSRSVSSASGIPDAIHPKKFNTNSSAGKEETENSHLVLNKNKSTDEINNNATNTTMTTIDDDSSDEDEYHPASTHPVEPAEAPAQAPLQEAPLQAAQAAPQEAPLQAAQAAPQPQLTAEKSAPIGVPPAKEKKFRPLSMFISDDTALSPPQKDPWYRRIRSGSNNNKE